jgi:hypothetical protein
MISSDAQLRETEGGSIWDEISIHPLHRHHPYFDQAAERGTEP